MLYIISERKELVRNVKAWIALAFVTKDKTWEEAATNVYHLLADSWYMMLFAFLVVLP
ncbi:hypothetical protein BGX20_007333, partial [Mortierella sp. AD010]